MPVSKTRELFTKWYVKSGYSFHYDFTDVPIIDDGILKTPLGMPKVVFDCPFWVKPLLIFFSPSIYVTETYGKVLIDGFMEGLEEGLKIE